MIWLLIPFVGTHKALWGCLFYFPFSPNKFNLLMFILSPAIQYELFTLHFPEIEAIGMFIAKNMQSIRLKQDALSLGYLLGYLLDYQFSPKATLDTLFTLASFFLLDLPMSSCYCFPSCFASFLCHRVVATTLLLSISSPLKGQNAVPEVSNLGWSIVYSQSMCSHFAIEIFY